MDSLRTLNPLALLVVLTTGVLVALGEVEGGEFLLLVTGLAIPAQSGGYQVASGGSGTVTTDPPTLPLASDGSAPGEPRPARRRR